MAAIGISCRAGTGLGWAALVLLAGCAGDPDGGVKPPPLGKVHGIVTLDGAPLANAQVTFVPAHSRSSVGQTNDSGEYTLKFDEKREGAAVGDHKVEIITKLEAGDSKEKLPPKFNSQSQLTATVAEGDNTFDFELQSK